MHTCSKMVGLQEYVDRKVGDFIDCLKSSYSLDEFKTHYVKLNKFLDMASNVGVDCEEHLLRGLRLKMHHSKKDIGGNLN